MDEIPVYAGNVSKSYSLLGDKVADMQTWNELLITTATSLLLTKNEDLSVKHLLSAEMMWFKELQSVHFQENCNFFVNLTIMRRKTVIPKVL